MLSKHHGRKPSERRQDRRRHQVMREMAAAMRDGSVRAFLPHPAAPAGQTAMIHAGDCAAEYCARYPEFVDVTDDLLEATEKVLAAFPEPK